MKRIIIGLAIVIFSVGFLSGQGRAETKTITLKAFASWPVTNNNVDTFKHFIQLVNERSKGALEIKLMGGPELISVKESLGSLGRGVMDMEHSNNIHFAISQVADFASSPEVAVNVWQDPELVRLVSAYYAAKANIVVLGSAGNTARFYVATSKKAVTKLEDVKGLRLRTHGGLSNVVTTALGAAPATIPTAEVYTALERGVVDGAMRALPSMVDFNESEVFKNVVTPNMFMGNAMICLNQDSWKKLPANLQKLLQDAVADNLRWAETYYEDLEKKSRETLAKKGVKFNAVAKDELVRWRKALDQPQRDWYLKQAGPEGKAVLSILDKHEKMR